MDLMIMIIIRSFRFSISSWVCLVSHCFLGICPYHLGFKHVDITLSIMLSYILVFAAIAHMSFFSILIRFIFFQSTKAEAVDYTWMELLLWGLVKLFFLYILKDGTNFQHLFLYHLLCPRCDTRFDIPSLLGVQGSSRDFHLAFPIW